MTDEAANPELEDAETGFRQLVTDFVLPTGADNDDDDDSNILRQPGPNVAPPKTLFMVYLRFLDDGIRVRQLLREFQGNVADAEKAAFDDARANVGVTGKNFGDMVWRRACYLTFVIDNPGWKFYWRAGHAGRRHEAIRFLFRKNLIGSDTETYKTKNYTFFDAETFRIGTDRRDAFRCINYFNDEVGYIGNSRRHIKYCFQVYLEIPFVETPDDGEPSHITVLIDPDGQNQGPRT